MNGYSQDSVSLNGIKLLTLLNVRSWLMPRRRGARVGLTKYHFWSTWDKVILSRILNQKPCSKVVL